jgi:multicomponent Na+:H+ antiporter subunit F
MNLTPFLNFITVILAFALIIPFYRVVQGPTLFDRMAGVSVISSKTIVLLALVGVMYGRLSMFVDIVIAYSLLNFVGTLVIAKYLEVRGGKR